MDMFLKVLVGAIIAIFAAIIGVYEALRKHTSHPKKHVCSDDVVFRDVCDERHKGVEDCIENVLKLTTIQYQNLSDKIDDLKESIENARK